MKNEHLTIPAQTVADAHIAELRQQLAEARATIRTLETRVNYWKNQYSAGRIDLRKKVVNPMRDALCVLIQTPYIATFLEQNDPKALEQAQRAVAL
jgi:hypothetical protein